ncbi:class I SAM-dependent methyltransferase [Seonamhaeicola sp. MEBiC1930]|uniref:rRNA adenine N-6-methyltransferase family protein n=1 Tax=Seonamhaeicola sp. MEBiC01930 TaxID=2976768 RepID=UPI00324377B1
MYLKKNAAIFVRESFHKLLYIYDSIVVKFVKRKDGVDFRKNVLPENLGEDYDYDKFVHYVPSRSWQIKKVIKILKITENDSIIDIGCGKGKAIYDFSNYKFKHIGGLELNEELAGIAKENMKILNLPDVEIYRDNALNFNNYDKYNHFYFYDPFNFEIFKTVIHNILENYKKKPREITVIYQHVRDHDKVLNEIDGFEMYRSYRNPVRIIIYKYNPSRKG